MENLQIKLIIFHRTFVFPHFLLTIEIPAVI